MTNTLENHYQTDVLGQGYEQLHLDFPDDASGKIIATLIRKKASSATKKAVLYIHGFVDYFFQTEMAEQFNQQGYDFYALDLRRYGRSYLPHQKYYEVTDLNEYHADIDRAIAQIITEQHTQIVLAGHSTGGLIASLYAAQHPQHPYLKALWCNSPFYDFNMGLLKKKLILPRLSALGKKFPHLKFPSELNPWYVTSLHQDFKGEWNFDLTWKKKTYPLVYLGFVHAIYEAQKAVHSGLHLHLPTLIMHSHKTTYPKKFNRDAQTTDIILDVKDIAKYAKRIKGDVSIIKIHHGLHDLVLSSIPVRAAVYQQLFQWLEQKLKS